MSFLDSLREKAKEHDSIVCMGIDPDIGKIPIEGNPEKVITAFYFDIIKAMTGEDAKPAIVKPNYAFFAQHGFEGLRALRNIIKEFQEENIPVILDGKRGDIGKTSVAYAKEIFNFWKADATTIAPYMGSDSVSPFIDYCEKGKGVYILNRTSNAGAKDLQDLKVGDTALFLKTSSKIVDWSKPGTGAVVGATYPKELEQISEFFVKSGKHIPFLIPGVGAQGGSAKEVVEALKKTENEIAIHRINSSSGINYAYKKMDTDDYAGAAVKAIQELNKEINFKPED